MSDSDIQSSPTKEEMDVSENGETSKNKEPDSDQEDTKPEKPAKKEEEEEEDDEEDDDEEPPLGLLERPVVLTSGKREKKKVERLAMSINLPNADRKKIDIQEGAGTKLGDCPRIEFKLNQTKAIDLKPLHRLLFNRAGANPEVKKNIRQFSGFTFKKGDKEFDKRMTSLNKMTIPGLKQICEVLDIERSGTKPSIIERIMDFLLKPTSSGLKVPQKKKRKSKGSGDGDKKGTKRKRSSKKKDTKSKANKDTVSDISDSDDEEEEEEEEEKKPKEEKSKAKSESEEEEEEEEPPKKKAKVEKKSPAKKEPAKTKKQNGKQEKAAKKEKKESKKKISDSEESDSDDEPLAAKKDEPPNNSELKDVIKKILDGANLEEVTMKTVVKQVYEKYPSFDLTDRKDFIKTTVREIIS